ncbi:MAG: prenyltransferase [Thermodesulfobacteriota bacterium]
MDKTATPSVVFGPMRVPFLLLTPVCVILGAAAAYYGEGAFRMDYFLLALAGGLCAHISVNAINEYDDFRSGLDHNTTRTPFSGGSGALPRNPEKAHYAAVIGAISLAGTVLTGIYFLRVWGAMLLPLGVLGLFTIVLYTRWLTRDPLLCLLAPGVGFGPCMVMGTDFVMTGNYSLAAFAASMVPFFLVSNLLLVNQFPDITPDADAGRRHLMIVFGKKAGAIVYGFFLAGAYLSVVSAWLAGWFPAWALACFLTLPLAVHSGIGIAGHSDSDAALEELLPYMGRNVIITLLTPALLAVGLIIGR